MGSASVHVANRVLRKIKLDILADYVWREFTDVSYASLLIQKLHLCSEIISKSYKLTFHGSHLSHNTSYSSVTALQVFCLL